MELIIFLAMMPDHNNNVSLTLPEYDGTVCPEVWIAQFKNVGRKYSVNDNIL